MTMMSRVHLKTKPNHMPDEDHDIPALTTEQMREVDRLMVDEYGIALLQMMEHAGRHLAHLARRRFLDGDPRDRTVVVLAGTGGNGGGGLVAARRLHGWGADVQVVSTKPPGAYDGVPAHQLAILQAMDVPVRPALDGTALPDADVLLDALIGYSLSGDPRGTAADLIRAANDHPAPVLSLDVPSGLDATTGAVHTPALRADATMTLALPKTGLHAEEARPVVGALYLADISVPPALYAEPSLDLDVPPIFASADLLHLW
jgi:NAD(P)H-hydrate epimerase